MGYYYLFSLSYRDASEILKERGISVHPPTFMRWVQEYGDKICNNQTALFRRTTIINGRINLSAITPMLYLLESFATEPSMLSWFLFSFTLGFVSYKLFNT